jgi:hypothetical protein
MNIDSSLNMKNQLYSGSIAGRYTVSEKIGSGSYGAFPIVY